MIERARVYAGFTRFVSFLDEVSVVEAQYERRHANAEIIYGFESKHRGHDSLFD